MVLDNKILIEKCRNKDRKAQMALYNKYSRGMYFVALRFFKDSFLAEEAMQESFIKAFTKLDQFTGDVTFGAWLKRIVINKSIDMLKARKLETTALNEQIMGTPDEFNDWEVEDNTTGYDHNEISEVLNITPVSSRTLVHRGKKRLQEQLKHLRYGTGS